jgi:hypothetical protein
VANDAESAWPRLIREVGVAVLGAFWIASVGWAVANGPGIRAAAEQRAVEEAEEESRTVCSRLGMSRGGDRYSACASELTWVRMQHEGRVARLNASW